MLCSLWIKDQWGICSPWHPPWEGLTGLTNWSPVCHSYHMWAESPQEHQLIKLLFWQCGGRSLPIFSLSLSAFVLQLLGPDVRACLWGGRRQEEKGTTEVEMVVWHHRLDGHEFEQAPGVGDGQGSLACCSLRGCKESDMTERLNCKHRIISQMQISYECLWVLLLEDYLITQKKLKSEYSKVDKGLQRIAWPSFIIPLHCEVWLCSLQ